MTSQILFPIFAVLKVPTIAGAGADQNQDSPQFQFKFKSQEDMSVWLSTTLVTALRDLIDLYTFYFGVLQEWLDGLLDILVACICQGDSTLSRSSSFL